MTIRDILKRIMKDGIEVYDKVKIKIDDREHEITDLIVEDKTVFIQYSVEGDQKK